MDYHQPLVSQPDIILHGEAAAVKKLKNVKGCLRTTLTTGDTTHLHSLKEENAARRLLRDEARHSHRIPTVCLEDYICQNEVCKALGAQVNEKREENGSICLSCWLWIMEEWPVVFALWPSGILASGSIGMPPLEKAKGLYDRAQTSIFHDLLSHWNHIGLLGREFTCEAMKFLLLVETPPWAGPSQRTGGEKISSCCSSS